MLCVVVYCAGTGTRLRMTNELNTTLDLHAFTHTVPYQTPRNINSCTRVPEHDIKMHKVNSSD